MPDLSGNDLGRYHIVEKLGEGGMALVYKAYDTRLERDVVVKFIRVDLIAAAYQGQMIKRFDREAKSLAKLSHPNILKIHDFGEYKGVPYLIMEYLPGGTLKALTGRPMPFKDAAALLAPIARALDYAHQENIIHCDIKPANILFSKTGIPILSNFGIAKINGIGEPAQLTDTFIAGTPEYIAPEQWENNISPKTDIYALGAVFYELVTGRTPYTADTPAAVLRKQLMDPLLSPAQFVPNLPEAVVKVINTALAKVPEERFVSMGEFAVALDNLAIQTDEVIEPSAIARGELASTPNVPGEKTQNTTLDKSIPILSQGEDASASLLIPKIVAKKRIPWGWIAAGVVSIVFATYLIVSSWGSNFGGLPQTELTRNSLKTSFAAQTTLASTAINSIAQFATSTTVALAPTPVPTILPPPKVKIKIGLSFPDISSVSVLLPRYHEESDLFHQMLEEKGYEVITSDAMGDPAQQNYQIDNMVSQGVKGLIIIAVDGDAVVSSVNKAADAGVKVMAYDRLINSPEISAYISFDYVSIGNNQAEGILTALNIDGGKWTKSNPAKVVILAGDPNDNKAILLHKGQMDVLQKYVDTGLIKIVDDQWIGNWSSGDAPVDAAERIENLIVVKKIRFDAVVASNDGIALGALTSLLAYKINIPISGQGASADGCNRIAKGELTFTILKDWHRLALTVPDIMDALLQRKPSPDLENFTLADLTNNKTAQGEIPCLFMPFVQVTKDNIDAVIVKGCILSSEDVYEGVSPTQSSLSLKPIEKFTATPNPPQSTDTNLKIGSTKISPKDSMTMVYIPAGKFQMGSYNGGAYNISNEIPMHTVYLDAYWIDQTDVTNAMYAKCVSSGSCYPPNSSKSATHDSYYSNSQFANFPVIYVDWSQADMYCKWAGRKLPTEAQWEKAARGTDGRTYPWGEGIDRGKANYNGTDTTEVGSYPEGASPYGALDMAGNVWQWVADWFSDDYYANSPNSNPFGRSSGSVKVLRGGSWKNDEDGNRSSVRSSYNPIPGTTDMGFGFRCSTKN